MSNRPISLVVHGGAWRIPEDEVAAHENGIREALKTGWEILRQGGSALDAVEATVVVLEEDPTFDAGRGSILTSDGTIEMDASIMDGRDLNAGAVAALRNFLHPVQVARRVLDRTEHLLLAGEGANMFALEQGFRPVPIRDLLTTRELKRLEHLVEDKGFRTEDAFGAKRGTVGAVALDREGHIAAATSTGGTPRKIPGRVGDSPLIGCGTWADDGAGGVSCTGWGESIIKVMLAHEAARHMEGGSAAQEAAEKAIHKLVHRVQGLGGLICLDPKGRVGVAYNTPRMARGYRTEAEDSFFVAVR